MSNANSYVDKALAKVGDLIIKRMEELKGEKWNKPWFSSSYQGVPQNISGRQYNGMNELILDFITTAKEHTLPVFLTFNQATKEGLRINKGSTSIPVLYYERTHKDENGKIVPESKVRELSLEEQSKLKVSVILRKFDVFNIDDTNLKEVKPELYEKFKKQYAVQELKDTQGMYSNKELDRMFEKQEWLCPITVKLSNSAYYSPSDDAITLPLKAQYKKGDTPEAIYRDGMEFYSTALHEMAHSTGSPTRLDREKGQTFGDAKYAKEELVAELTSALIGRNLGFDKNVSDNSLKYMNSWVGALKSEPRFVLTVLGDVAKAHGVIMGEVEKQQLALQQTFHEQKQDSLRRHTIDRVLNSNINLAEFSNSRVKIEQVGRDQYHFSSNLRLHSSEINDFIYRFMRSRLPQEGLLVEGNASHITGFFLASPQQIIHLQPSQEQKGKKSRSLYELQAQFSNINARYPSIVEDAATRQIAHRIAQAHSIINKYHENIEKYYGTDWLQNPQNAHTIIPKEIYMGSLKQSEHIVGTITWPQSGEKMYFSDKEAYLSTISRELNSNPTGFVHKTLSQEPSLLKAVDDKIHGHFGLENPKSLADYERSQKNITEASLVKMRDGNFAVRAKIDGVDTGLMPIKNQDAVTYMKFPEQHQRDKFLNELVSRTFSPQNSLSSSPLSKSLHP